MNPAYRIETERLVIRCWNPGDAPLLMEAINDSLDSLKKWMPWGAQEPEELSAKVARLRRMRSCFDSDKDYVYGIFNADETKVMGGTGLHRRLDQYALEIGYWIRSSHHRQGLGTEIVSALTKVAFEVHVVDRVEIRCDPVNEASSGVARKAGFTHEATLKRRINGCNNEGLRDSMIWSIFKTEYLCSDLKKFAIKAYDVVGEPLSLDN